MRRVIDTWLYGEHSTGTRRRAGELAEFDRPDLILFMFITVIGHASLAYAAFAGLAEALLEGQPALPALGKAAR